MQPTDNNTTLSLINSQSSFDFPFGDGNLDPVKLIVLQYLNPYDQYRLAEHNQLLKTFLITEVTLDIDQLIKYIDENHARFLKIIDGNNTPLRSGNHNFRVFEPLEHQKKLLSSFESLKQEIMVFKTPSKIDLDYRKESLDVHGKFIELMFNCSGQVAEDEKRSALKKFKGFIEYRGSVSYLLGYSPKGLVPIDAEIALRIPRSDKASKCIQNNNCMAHDLELACAKDFAENGMLERALELTATLHSYFDKKFILTLIDTCLQQDEIELAKKGLLALGTNWKDLIDQAQEKIITFYLQKNEFPTALEMTKTLSGPKIKEKVLVELVNFSIANKNFSNAKEAISLIEDWEFKKTSLINLVDAYLKNGDIIEARNSLSLLNKGASKDDFYVKFVDYFIGINEGSNAEIETTYMWNGLTRYQALKRIIDLYLAQGKPEEAERVATKKLINDPEQQQILEKIRASYPKKEKIVEVPPVEEKPKPQIQVAVESDPQIETQTSAHDAQEKNNKKVPEVPESFSSNQNKQVDVRPTEDSPKKQVQVAVKSDPQLETQTSSPKPPIKVEDKVVVQPVLVNQNNAIETISNTIESLNTQNFAPSTESTSATSQSKKELSPEIKKGWFTLLVHRIAVYVSAIFNGIKVIYFGALEAASRLINRVTKNFKGPSVTTRTHS